jgi:hypothetical protein
MARKIGNGALSTIFQRRLLVSILDIPLNTTGEKPLCVLKENKKNLIYANLILVGLTLYFIFGIIIPVLATSDFSAAMVSRHNAEKAFFIACIGIWPFSFLIILFTRRAGTYAFYGDRIEFRALWLGRKINIPYNRMYIYVKTGRVGTLITKLTTITIEKLPDWSNPFYRFKVEYWDGLAFGVAIKDTLLGDKISKLLCGEKGPATIVWGKDFDFEEWEKALQLLKEKALSFNEV